MCVCVCVCERERERERWWWWWWWRWCLSLSIYLSVCLSVYLSLCLPVCRGEGGGRCAPLVREGGREMRGGAVQVVDRKRLTHPPEVGCRLTRKCSAFPGGARGAHQRRGGSRDHGRESVEKITSKTGRAFWKREEVGWDRASWGGASWTKAKLDGIGYRVDVVGDVRRGEER